MERGIICYMPISCHLLMYYNPSFTKHLNGLSFWTVFRPMQTFTLEQLTHRRLLQFNISLQWGIIWTNVWCCISLQQILSFVFHFVKVIVCSDLGVIHWDMFSITKKVSLLYIENCKAVDIRIKRQCNCVFSKVLTIL